MAAGLSLGEYSALQAAGVFDSKTAVELVAFRGKAMAQAVQDRPCGMAAVLMLGREQLAECCRQAGEAGVVEIANYNCPTQLVIAGDAAAVEKAGELALQAGAKRVVPLKVSGPFHTSLMAPAGEALAEKFRSVAFGSEQRLSGGHHPRHGGDGRGHHRGDRAGQGSVRICEKDGKGHQDLRGGDGGGHREAV